MKSLITNSLKKSVKIDFTWINGSLATDPKWGMVIGYPTSFTDNVVRSKIIGPTGPFY